MTTPARTPSAIALLAAAAVAAPMIATVAAAGTASAAPQGVPAVNTQRMSDATLNSTQNGWYSKGQRLNLVCFKRGQSVKGYYSPYVGNGGWSNIWYKVSDNYFVADIDLETGSNNPVTAECSNNPAPAPQQPTQSQSTKADRAVAWANSQVGSNAYPGLCGKFVANAYGKSALGYNTAMEFYNALRNAGQIRTTGTPPNGALVFSKSSSDGGAGHVDLARSDGKFVSGGVSTSYGTGRTVQVLTTTNPSRGATYLGWAYAPANWPGR